MFTGCTDEDIREMYRRQNNGKSLSNTQKRTAIESDELSEIVFSLADHPFFTKVLGKNKLKKDVQRDYIREVLIRKQQLLQQKVSIQRDKNRMIYLNLTEFAVCLQVILKSVKFS